MDEESGDVGIGVESEPRLNALSIQAEKRASELIPTHGREAHGRVSGAKPSDRHKVFKREFFQFAGRLKEIQEWVFPVVFSVVESLPTALDPAVNWAMGAVEKILCDKTSWWIQLACEGATVENWQAPTWLLKFFDESGQTPQTQNKLLTPTATRDLLLRFNGFAALLLSIRRADLLSGHLAQCAGLDLDGPRAAVETNTRSAQPTPRLLELDSPEQQAIQLALIVNPEMKTNELYRYLERSKAPLPDELREYGSWIVYHKANPDARNTMVSKVRSRMRGAGLLSDNRVGKSAPLPC